MENLKALAMPCTQEQAKEMTELCEKHGIKIWSRYNNSDSAITNSYADAISNVGFTTMENCNADGRNPTRTLIPYNPALFLYSLGVFPEKWAVKNTKGSVEPLKHLCNSLGWNDINNYLTPTGSVKAYYFLDKGIVQYSDYGLPENYIEVTLEDLIKHYEIQTNVMEGPTHRFKTLEEFEATHTKTASGYYCGSHLFTEEMKELLGKPYLNDAGKVTTHKLISGRTVHVSPEMLTPISSFSVKLNISREEWLAIYEIACPSWKEKLLKYAKDRLDVLSLTIHFSEDEVFEMINAARPDQQSVVNRIFGNGKDAILLKERRDLEKKIKLIDELLNSSKK